MTINLSLLSSGMADLIMRELSFLNIDAEKIIQTTATMALNEIQQIIQNEDIEDDFLVVEEIVSIMGKYQIDTGFRHDF